MVKAITTTTIFPPSESLIKFSQMEGWHLVVAGDLKTPDYSGMEHNNNRFHYLKPSMQEACDKKLSDLIGWNCIQRRNFAFLFACKELKADLVCSIDDDNIPMDNWGEEIHVGKTVECDEYHPEVAFDPLSITDYSDLWHRGFPLELVSRKNEAMAHDAIIECDVQANLWNGEADVDAICRMTHDTANCNFQFSQRLYTSNKPSPFNSQNTFLSREVMPHYFMFPGIGRYDDIMASYHVQAQGFRVMYGGPTVTQIRNKHNLIEDLKNEMWGMENCLSIVKDVPHSKNAVLDKLPPRSVEAFRAYQKHFE